MHTHVSILVCVLPMLIRCSGTPIVQGLFEETANLRAYAKRVEQMSDSIALAAAQVGASPG
jgi:hypothetical protein